MLKLLLDYKVIGFFIEKILLRFNKADSQVILKKLKKTIFWLSKQGKIS